MRNLVARALLLALGLAEFAPAHAQKFGKAGGIGASTCLYVLGEPVGGPSCYFSINGATGIGTLSGLHVNGPSIALAANPTVATGVYSAGDGLTSHRESYTFSGTHTVSWAAHTIEFTDDGASIGSVSPATTTGDPSRAAYGLTINGIRRNFPTDLHAGEIDGLSVVTRNYGDTSGVLVNAGCIIGTCEGFEGSARLFNTAGVTLTQIQTQVGEVFPGGANGFVTFCGVGLCSNAYFAANNGGAFQNFLAFDTDITHSIHRTLINGDGTENDLASNLAAQDARLTLGLGRTGSGNTYFDMFGDATYSGYGLRIARYAGPNGGTSLIARGNAQFTINSQDAGGSVALQSNGANLLIAMGSTVSLPAGQVLITEVAPTAVATPAAGTQILFIDATSHKLSRKDSTGTVTAGF